MILLLIEVQDELSKNFDAKRTLELILLLIIFLFNFTNVCNSEFNYDET